MGLTARLSTAIGVALLVACASDQVPPAGPAPPVIVVSAPEPTIEPAPTASVEPIPPTMVEASLYTVVRVFYGTNRARGDSASFETFYGTRRGILGFGFSDVSIPDDHVIGEIERPSLWRLEFSEDPEEHVVIRALNPVTQAEFQSAIARAVDRSADKSALVFIHGYNVTFAEALRRTAQIAYDIGFTGAPVLFSWPSRGSTTSYTRDEADIEWTEPMLTAFLRDLAASSGSRVIHLVAHSMGSRAMVRALSALQSDPATAAVFRNLILAAPDIDADVFRTQILPRLRGGQTRVTLYASSADQALQASKTVHGYPRAGDAGSALIVEDGLDTIDASTVDAGFLGHSYFSGHRSVISDIRELVVADLAPRLRGGIRAARDGRPYWHFPD